MTSRNTLVLAQILAQIRTGEIFNGPLALIFRFFGFIPWAATSFLAGAVVSRIGWVAVGKISGSDPDSGFAAEHY